MPFFDALKRMFGLEKPFYLPDYDAEPFYIPCPHGCPVCQPVDEPTFITKIGKKKPAAKKKTSRKRKSK